MIANAHMRNFHDDRRTEIRAVADLSKKAREAMAAEYDIPLVTRDHRIREKWHLTEIPRIIRAANSHSMHLNQCLARS